MNLRIDPSEVRLPDYSARQRILAAGAETELPILQRRIKALESQVLGLMGRIDLVQREKDALRQICDETIRRVEAENARLMGLVSLSERQVRADCQYRSTISKADFKALMLHLDTFARAMGVRVADILGPCRDRDIVNIRHAAMYEVAIAFPTITISKLGQKVFSRDHSTVFHGLSKHAKVNNLPLPSQCIYLNRGGRDAPAIRASMEEAV